MNKLSIAKESYASLCSFENLKLAAEQAAKGKRGKIATAYFEARFADNIIELQKELTEQRYQPGNYSQFTIHEPKQRLISAAPFRDLVVHHAYCQVIEPVFERLFIPHSYANRVGKGNHLAVSYLQRLARKNRYVLRMDIQKFFESIDHKILLEVLWRQTPVVEIQMLCEKILAGGPLEKAEKPEYFPGDDLFSPLRPKGLPIGNLTSQFWANCYLHSFDIFVKRELACKSYLRYVDDFALFHEDKRVLLEWKNKIIQRLQCLRLRAHETKAHVIPCEVGIPWLGFVVYPEYKKVKARKVVYGRRKVYARYQAYCGGSISFAELDASVQGWLNHLAFADTWRLREKLLQPLTINRP